MIKTVGFPISHKENENRRAIVPAHLKNVKHPELLYFKKAQTKKGEAELNRHLSREGIQMT